MPLDNGAIGAIETLLAVQDVSTAVHAVRTCFPELRVTRCDLSDVDTEIPFRSWPHLSLFLVDNAGHCSRLTVDPSVATGLLVASA